MDSKFSIGQRPAQYIRMGEEAEAEGKIEEAFSFFEQAYLLDSTSFEASVAYARGARATKDYSLAEHLYGKIFQKDGGKLLPDGLFWLAMMQKYNGRYEEAMRNFKKYAKKHKKKGEYTYEKAMRESESCAWALNYNAATDSIHLTPLESQINTSESEIAPVLRGDLFYYSAFRHNENRWTMKVALWSDSIAQEEHSMADLSMSNADITFQENLSLAFFTQCDENGRCAIYSASITSAGFIPNSLSEVSNVNVASGISTMPNIAVIDGFTYLFFVSDREGGIGGLDIWYSRLSGESWSDPVNAGDAINSPEDDLSPFYKNGFLYFSSSWHNGFGGHDIFRIKGKPGQWNIPENMGKPINSEKNDLFFSFYPENYRLFLSSNRIGGRGGVGYSTCCNDLYTASFYNEVEVEEVREFASLKEMNDFLPVTLYFHNDEPNPHSHDTTTTIKYSEAYQSYKNLSDIYLKENARDLSGNEKENAEYDVEDFFRLKVDKGMEDLNLFSELLLEELQNGKQIRLSIRGFASPRAQSDYNENLTMRRIASLVNEMKVMKDGAFVSFINGTNESGGRLEFEALPFGENQASKEVSDDLTNEKQSIFSRGARLERKIEIESVDFIEEEKKSILRMDTDFYDFGQIPKFGVVHHVFYLFNEGSLPLLIDSVVAECGCTDPQLAKNTILPGEKVALDVGFDPFGKKGRESKSVTIYQAGEKPKVFSISADVLR